jgi:adhesin transport system outer membrane protein
MWSRNIAPALTALMLLAVEATAAPAGMLQDAVKKAIVGNPEVQARWHAFLAADAEVDVARGGYYPRLDVTTGVGRQNLKQPGLPVDEFTRRGTALSLNQIIYDGFATRSEVSRLGYAKLARYYEVLDASETTALEAVRAYEDVLRYRELSRLAQENFAQHKQIFDQIQQRAQAGIGRRVDLEQAGGRLALAQSNLLTEASNLHDVSARYQRIVGELPAGEMLAPELRKYGLPASIEAALKLAFQGSPAFNAAIENVRAAQSEAGGTKANFHPQVDLRASKDISYNRDGVAGRRDDEIIELVLNYNLFNGGSDRARVRQFAERLELARDLRDKACRDIRQTLAIAYNDVNRLAMQLTYLDQHQLAIEKAREAYRRQFDIGQRTLLDLLDTENEYFQARRAYANAVHEHALAHARTLAGMGNLLASLGVARDGMPGPAELGQDRKGVDEADIHCPGEAPMPASIEPALADIKAAATPEPVRPPPAPAAQQPAVQQALAGWAAAWSAKDSPRYLAYYAASFVPEGGRSRAQWQAERQARLGKPGEIRVTVGELKITPEGTNRAVTEFRQDYTSQDFRDSVMKRLEWVREEQAWKITREQTLPPAVALPQIQKSPAGKSKPRKRVKYCPCPATAK